MNLTARKSGKQYLFEIMKEETANQITRNVLRIVNLHPGCVAYRINNVGIYDEAKGVHRRANTEKGIPDVLGVIKGRFLAVEVKAGRDKMSEDQLKRKFEIEKAGGIYIEARSTDGFIKEFESITK